MQQSTTQQPTHTRLQHNCLMTHWGPKGGRCYDIGGTPAACGRKSALAMGQKIRPAGTAMPVASRRGPDIGAGLADRGVRMTRSDLRRLHCTARVAGMPTPRKLTHNLVTSSFCLLLLPAVSLAPVIHTRMIPGPPAGFLISVLTLHLSPRSVIAVNCAASA